MTVAQLIRALTHFPMDTKVAVRAYESGYSDADVPSIVCYRQHDPTDSKEGYYLSAYPEQMDGTILVIGEVYDTHDHD